MAARKGAWGIARIVNLVARLVAAVLVLAILLVVLEANRANEIVEAVLDAGRFLAGPFEDMFDLSRRKVEVAVNYGIAAARWPRERAGARRAAAPLSVQDRPGRRLQ